MTRLEAPVRVFDSSFSKWRAVLATAVAGSAWLALAGGVFAQARPSAPSALPDWSGIWQLQGGTVFDRSTLQPPDGRSGDAGVREFPPYTDAYETIYREHIERVRQGAFPDPISTCGTPHGFPRLMNLPDVYEFALTPKATYILAENGPALMRIYTDGRTHPAPEDLWPTYTGASVGRWEGDTLVFTTVSMKGSKDNDVILDRTGLVLSDAARVVTRIRKVDDATLEARMVIEDAKALKAPWHVTKTYKRQAEGTWAWDYACAENNRNPIAGSGKTLTLGPDGKPIDKVVD
jgi:hypothetical protein